jgi:hypothetical protein
MLDPPHVEPTPRKQLVVRASFDHPERTRPLSWGRRFEPWSRRSPSIIVPRE